MASNVFNTLRQRRAYVLLSMLRNAGVTVTRAHIDPRYRSIVEFECSKELFEHFLEQMYERVIPLERAENPDEFTD